MARDSGQEGGGRHTDKSQQNGAKKDGGSGKYGNTDTGGKHGGGKK